MQKRASFVMPVYNGMAYLAEALDSCVRQNFKGIEIIVVDDCSNDATKDMLSYFAEKDVRIRILRHEVNRGRSAARNTGIAAATTDILLMMDSDDIALPDRVSKTLEFFKRNPEVDVTYSKFQVIDELDNIIGFCDVAPFNWEKTKETGFTYIGHSTMAFRKKVGDAIKYTEGDYCKHAIDDWKFQIDAYKAGFRFGPVNKILVQYRQIIKKRDEAFIKKLKAEAIA